MKVVNVLEGLSQSPKGDFKELLLFNNKAVGAVDIHGVSPVWEMHPESDELFYVIEGVLEIELLTDAGSKLYSASANETMVVPKGFWHKPSAPNGAKFFYLIAGQSLHSDEEDPRA
jgi:mannose-6-phosphate isomerase-like protein (cupin superfamily)